MIIVPKHKKYTKNPNLDMGLKKSPLIVQIFIFIVFFFYLSVGIEIIVFL